MMRTTLSIKTEEEWLQAIKTRTRSDRPMGDPSDAVVGSPTTFLLEGDLFFTKQHPYYRETGSSDDHYLIMGPGDCLDGQGHTIRISPDSVPEQGCCGWIRGSGCPSRGEVRIENIKMVMEDGVHYMDRFGSCLFSSFSSEVLSSISIHNMVLENRGIFRTPYHSLLFSASFVQGCHAISIHRFFLVNRPLLALPSPTFLFASLTGSQWRWTETEIRDDHQKEGLYVVGKVSGGHHFVQGLLLVFPQMHTSQGVWCSSFQPGGGLYMEHVLAVTAGGETDCIFPRRHQEDILVSIEETKKTRTQPWTFFNVHTTAARWYPPHDGMEIETEKKGTDHHNVLHCCECQTALSIKDSILPQFPPSLLLRTSIFPFFSISARLLSSSPVPFSSPRLITIGSWDQWKEAIHISHQRASGQERNASYYLYRLESNMCFTRKQSYFLRDSSGGSMERHYLTLYDGDRLDGNGWSITFIEGCEPDNGFQGLVQWRISTRKGQEEQTKKDNRWAIIENIEINIGPRMKIKKEGLFGVDKSVCLFVRNVIVLSAVALPHGWMGETCSSLSCENVSVSFLVPFREKGMCGYGGHVEKNVQLYHCCVIIPFVVDECALFFRSVGRGVRQEGEQYAIGMYGVYASLRDQRRPAFDSSWIQEYETGSFSIHYRFEEMYMAIGGFPTNQCTEVGCSFLGTPSCLSEENSSKLFLGHFVTNSTRIGHVPLHAEQKEVLTGRYFQFEALLGNDRVWNQLDQTIKALPPRLHALYRGGHFVSEEFPTSYLSYFDQPSFYNSCFTLGTWIQMADGTFRPIEEITVGESIRLPHHGSSRVVGVWKHYVSEMVHHKYGPIKIPKDFFEEGSPWCDTYLSANHAIEYQGRLLHAGCLFPFSKDRHPSDTLYYHLETENYWTDRVNANGIWCETHDTHHRHGMNYEWTCVRIPDVCVRLPLSPH